MPIHPILDYLWIIPLLPLLGAAINGLFGAKWANKIVSAVAVGSTGLSFAAALEAVREFTQLSPEQIPWVKQYFSWIAAGAFRAGFNLQVDQLTVVMLMVVTGVGWLIHIYSIGYMAHEGGYYRFFSYLNLFMFFMLILVMAANYVLLFVGWEGVGLSSYLLIGFYFLKKSAADAGKKAFIVNRIGDFGFMLGMFLLFRTFGTLDFVALFDKAGHWPAEAMGQLGTFTIACLLLFMGACGKSAQLPLYVWLPDAMEGPTPVSALIHAATMVTAGVYVVARSHVLFTHAPAAMLVVAIVGCATAFFAATIGLVQTDIKRVLAYSTVSQLLPRCRQRDSRRGRRAGYAPHGRPQRQDSLDLSDDVDRHAGHRRCAVLRRLLFQRRHPFLRFPIGKWRTCFVCVRIAHCAAHFVLHVPPDFLDLPRQAPL